MQLYNIIQIVLYVLNLEFFFFFPKTTCFWLKSVQPSPTASQCWLKSNYFNRLKKFSCVQTCAFVNWANIHHSSELLWCPHCHFGSWDDNTSLSLLLFPIAYSSPGHRTLNLARHRADSFSGRHAVSYSYLFKLYKCPISKIFKNAHRNACQSHGIIDFDMNLRAAGNHKLC